MHWKRNNTAKRRLQVAGCTGHTLVVSGNGVAGCLKVCNLVLFYLQCGTALQRPSFGVGEQQGGCDFRNQPDLMTCLLANYVCVMRCGPRSHFDGIYLPPCAFRHKSTGWELGYAIPGARETNEFLHSVEERPCSRHFQGARK